MGRWLLYGLVFVLAAWALAASVLPTTSTGPRDLRVRRGVEVVWKTMIALATPMLMLAGPAWVFSEAIMWGVAAAVLFQWRLYCEMEEPSSRNQVLLAGALALAVLNRPTLGLGCLLGGLQRPHDGTVAQVETRLPGARQSLAVPASHFGLLVSAQAARQVCAFLRRGLFNLESSVDRVE